MRRAARFDLAVAIGVKKDVRKKAEEAIGEIDLKDLLELIGADGGDGAAEAALKAVLAERMAECAIGAMEEAKRRKARMGAATVIIAAAKR